MDRKISKILALSIVVIMLSTMLCSCDNSRTRKKTADQAVIEETEKFCQAILNADAEAIEDLALDDFEDESCSKVLKYYYNNPSWSNSRKKISNAIFNSLTYRIDKNSVLASYANEKGTIDVVFTYVDYLSCLAENQNSTESDFADLLENYNKTTYKVITLDYVYDDSEWLLDDYEKAFIDLFEWRDTEFLFVYDFKSHINSFEIINDSIPHGENNTYLNVSEFRVGIDTTNNFGDWESCYMYMYLDGQQLEFADISGYGMYSSYDYESVFSADYALGEDYYPSGNYEIVLYDYLDNIIDSFTFEMEYNPDKVQVKAPSKDNVYSYGSSPYVTDISYASWYYLTEDDFELDIFLYSYVDWDGDFDYYYAIGDSDTDDYFYTSEYLSADSEGNSWLEIIGDFDDVDFPSDVENTALYVFDEDDNLMVKAVINN